MSSIGNPYIDKGKLRALLKKASAKGAWELLNLSGNQL